MNKTRLALLLLAPALPGLIRADQPSFVNDIVPIFTKSGCANSNCHGSIRGQNGFKLSLFGYEPEQDFEAVTKASDGRRIDLKNPEQSLILRKPTFAIPHGGGERFQVGSLEYNAILDWLKAGAEFDDRGAPRLETLRVTPEEILLTGLTSRAQLSVSGSYTDGTTADLSRKVQYTPNDESVVEVT